ncbi:MAG: hypothetical protein AB8B81_20830 [Halioglobus sp.]
MTTSTRVFNYIVERNWRIRFVKQNELANNTRALHKIFKQSAKQTHLIAATDMNAHQGSFFQIAESVNSQHGGISEMLYASSLAPAGSGAMYKEQMDDTFQS